MVLMVLFSLFTIVVFCSAPAFAIEETDEVILNPNFDPADIDAWTEELLSNADSVTPTGDFKVPQLRSTSGNWSWRDGVICVTDSYAVFDFFNNGHAGIVAVAPHYYSTVEANPGTGVTVVYGHWADRFTGRVYQVGVLSTSVQQEYDASRWACNQIGKPYGFPIALGNRSKFYCSQLVYAAYKDTAGVNLDTAAWPGFIHPFELLDTRNVKITYSRIP